MIGGSPARLPAPITSSATLISSTAIVHRRVFSVVVICPNTTPSALGVTRVLGRQCDAYASHWMCGGRPAIRESASYGRGGWRGRRGRTLARVLGSMAEATETTCFSADDSAV